MRTTPITLLARRHALRVTVFGRRDLQRLRMGSFLAVAQGTPQDAGVEHVGLVHRRQPAIALARRVEAHARDALDLRHAVVHRVEAFVVARVVLQDFTGVPLLADLAAMRDVAARLGRNPKAIEPLVP